ncbi:mitochondrial import receptor subunit TOM22 homolog [Biomphalaria glabrata]|uniref:Mitochondrial import receptor subunit TOM22 homolog n=1 Tax=Biomphalaria glabrata TaxID=6526 RepID=A0A9W2ZQ16_BIOGL|nr:mitochondrial import receptor subunit TOM22 homolog [Biomphalaria glabrata]KAI8765112.1 mitochondrial import receptor subunit TOM22-like protein [Biomphalaria glabrata]
MADQPSKKAIEEDDEDLDEDESLSERLIGLTEMFPETFRKSCQCACYLLSSVTKNSLYVLRSALWIASSSAVILVLPVIFESERAQQHEEQLQQQRQILLGPNAAVSGTGGSNNLLPGMGMVPPPRSSA